MTSQRPVSATPTSIGALKALMVPADPTRPVHQLPVESLQDVRDMIGCQVEAFTSVDPDVWGYAAPQSSCLDAAEPNARAAWLLKSDGRWINGDVVLVALDAQRQPVEMPAAFAALIHAPHVLADPDVSARGNIAAFHAWQLASSEGQRVMAMLTIMLCPALEEPIGTADEYTAMLSRRTEQDDLFCGRLCIDGPHTALCVLRQRGRPVTRSNTVRFAAQALATVNALYEVWDERVCGYFRVPA